MKDREALSRADCKHGEVEGLSWVFVIDLQNGGGP